MTREGAPISPQPSSAMLSSPAFINSIGGLATTRRGKVEASLWRLARWGPLRDRRALLEANGRELKDS